MEKLSLTEMKEDFKLYLFGIDNSLFELELFLAKASGKNKKILDYSLESLDLTEQIVDKVLEGKIPLEIPLANFLTRVSTYLGEIVRKKRNGTWKLCLNEDDFDFGYPRVESMDGFDENFGWCPMVLVSNFRHNRKPNSFKSAISYMVGTGNLNV